jgi:integrase
VSERGVGLMALGFKRAPGKRGRENALRTVLARDGLLRQGEIDKLRIGDCSFARDECALALGVVQRGERTKTGVRQGVCLRDPLVIALLRGYVDGRASGAKVFTRTTAQSFRKDWAALRDRLGLPDRPPHALRHAGAAELVRSGWRLADVKVRGRWRCDASVRRYTKTHDLVAYDAAVARLPVGLVTLADSWIADSAAVWHRA